MLQLDTKILIKLVTWARVHPRDEAQDLLNEVRSELHRPRLQTVHLGLTLILACMDETVVQGLGDADKPSMERLQVEAVLHAYFSLFNEVADPILECGRSYIYIDYPLREARYECKQPLT